MPTRASRGTRASDLMDPVRPIVDKDVLDSLTGRELERGDVVETREGVCRLCPELAHQPAGSAAHLRSSIAPEVAQVRSRVLAGAREQARPTAASRQQTPRERSTQRCAADRTHMAHIDE
jgi:hypothetical protein